MLRIWRESADRSLLDDGSVETIQVDGRIVKKQETQKKETTLRLVVQVVTGVHATRVDKFVSFGTDRSFRGES